MGNKSENIHPIFDQLLQRSDKESFLKQKSKVVWFTGLSGSGKSTIAQGLEKLLHETGFFTKVLDGDNIRTGINKNLTFTAEDRVENIRRIAEVSKLFVEGGVITLNSFVSPTIEIRDMARSIIGADNFLEVYVNVPLEVAEARDVKGLYKKARSGEIKNFTGIDAPFEAPTKPFLDIRTDKLSVEEAVQVVFEAMLPHIK